LLALAVAIAFAGATSGCLSHEYRVSRRELDRLAQLPPDARGQQVRVVQKIGARRAPPVTPGIPVGSGVPPGALPPPGDGDWYPDDGRDGDPAVFGDIYVQGGVSWSGPGGGGAGHGPPPPGAGSGSWHRSAGPPSGGPVTIARPAGAQPSLAGAAVPARPAAVPSGGRAVAPPAGASSGSGGSSGGALGGLSLPSSGGGGGSDELVVYAVIAIAVASMAVVGLGATEGMRFDGDVSLPPGQLVYLQRNGAEQAVPLHLLSAADLAGVDEALVRDDEGYGLWRRDRAPLDRRGFAFKVDVGGMRTLDHELMSGFASHIQLGYFPHHRVGLLAGLSLAGLEDPAGDTVARHALTAELQLFPLSWWRLHLGAAAHVGRGLVPVAGGGHRAGLATGAAGLFELALTTRLALTARWDWSRTRVDPGVWSSANGLSVGLAVY
jgi:hypothetical protein